jgi:heat shock protein HslJ
MKMFRPLLLPLLLLAFAGCDRTVGSGAVSESERTGALDFSLDAALRAQVASTADSLRVEMRQGAVLKTRSVALDGAVRMDGLDAGAWKISVGLYKAGGSLAYFGEDSVKILPGQTAKAVVTLRPAKGSVDIVIRLEDTPQTPTALQGQWFLRQVGTYKVSGKSILLRLGDSGNATGSDGCNSIWGSYTASPTTIRFGSSFASTKMYCDIYATMPSVTDALVKARFWMASAADDLVFTDSLGKEVLHYARTPPPVDVPVPPAKTIDTVRADTTGRALVAIRLDTAVATDSGVWLDVTLPYPGLDIQLFALARAGGWVTVDTLVDADGRIMVKDTPDMTLPRVLVAGSIPKVGVPTIQVLTPAKAFVPWTVIGPLVMLVDHSGRSLMSKHPDYWLL